MSKTAQPSLRILTLAGRDASSFLQGYVTCEMDDLAETRACPMGFTDIRGRVICNGWIYGSSERVFIVLHNSLVDALKQHLSKYVVFSHAEFDEAVQTVSIKLDGNADEVALEPFNWTLTTDCGVDDELGEASIVGRYPILEERTAGKFLPQMIGLADVNGVSFTKGCYLGQEVVARAQHRGQVKRKLRLFDWDGQHLAVGDAVESADSARGTVVAVHGHQALVVVTGEPVAMSAGEARLTVKSEP